MTKQEHELMMTLFATQFHYLTMIAEVLASRGVMEPDDVVPFLQLVSTQKPAQAFVKNYYELAAQLGVEVPS